MLCEYEQITDRNEAGQADFRCQKCAHIVHRCLSQTGDKIIHSCLTDRVRRPLTHTAAPARPHGPGTELKKLLAELGVTGFDGCGCGAKAAQMDAWGVEGCRENFDTIRDWIIEAQASAGWATKITAAVKAAVSGLAINLSDVPGSLVRIAIERAS